MMMRLSDSWKETKKSRYRSILLLLLLLVDVIA
jgi:hypothetical protein